MSTLALSPSWRTNNQQNSESWWLFAKKNLYHAQELQKCAYDEGVKPKSYISNEKIWLNSKYIKIQCKRKLEAKFFRQFQVLYPVRKQAYKLELFN